MPLLKKAPTVMAITVLRQLQADQPGNFADGVLRTRQRPIRQWRALAGPPQDVFCPPVQAPGQRGRSDFTTRGELRLTRAGAPFVHRRYHFVLAFSRWAQVAVVERGERFEARSNGVQNALWQAGGAPQEQRTDRLSAAVKNLTEAADFTARDTALLAHYGLTGTRNHRGLSPEHGRVASAHRQLKEALEHARLRRGHRDFNDRAAYAAVVRAVVSGVTVVWRGRSVSNASTCQTCRPAAPLTASRTKRASHAAAPSRCARSSTARRRG